MKTTSFNNKKAIIIDGTGGMGKATAKLLLESGAEVIIASKTQASVDAAVAELSAFGKVSGIRVDITSASWM